MLTDPRQPEGKPNQEVWFPYFLPVWRLATPDFMGNMAVTVARDGCPKVRLPAWLPARRMVL
jgi:hypothetical protein